MFEAVYTNPEAKGEEGKAIEIVKRLYEYFSQNSSLLPKEYHGILEREGPDRAVCDYVSGMTDRYCVAMYEDLFIPKSWRSKDVGHLDSGFVSY